MKKSILYIKLMNGPLHVSSTTQLSAYTDANWAGGLVTRRSTSGHEAEYRGVANLVAETTWIRNLLCELHTSLFTATLVYCDNVSAAYMSTNPVQHQRTKHIEIDIHFVRDFVASGQVQDVVHYALEGLSDTYNQVCGCMHWKDAFPDLKAVRSLLIAKEIRLKLKGSCRFGDSCRYVHDVNACVSNANSGFNKGHRTSENTTNDLLTKLLKQLGRLGMNVAMSNNELCASYEVDRYLHSPINETSALAPLTPKETKVDKIVLSWILFTLSNSLHARIVVAHPKSANEA
nr:ribonuclease H-like domain-containing protein [Tanacetum cinerariifolium]